MWTPHVYPRICCFGDGATRKEAKQFNFEMTYWYWPWKWTFRVLLSSNSVVYFSILWLMVVYWSLVMWHNLRSHSFLPDQECHLAYKLYTYQHHYMLLWQHLQQLFFSFLKEKVNFVDRTACGVFPPLSLWSQTCSNEVKCICASDYTGKDCSVFDPIPIPTVPTGPEKKGSHCSEASLSFPHSFFLSFMVSVHHHRSFMY